jgi:hypothetical protein
MNFTYISFIILALTVVFAHETGTGLTFQGLEKRDPKGRGGGRGGGRGSGRAGGRGGRGRGGRGRGRGRR